jgi:hypothetical protein
MKRLLSMTVGFVLMTYAAFAQFEEAKNMLLLQQYGKALESVNSTLAKPKNATKPEGQILKAAVLAGQIAGATDDASKDKLLAESMDAYNKYMEMDPKKALITDPAYANTPIVYYSTYYNKGIAAFKEKDYKKASDDFSNTVKWSDYLIQNKIISMEFDTTANLLAGASYQNLKEDESAVAYFTKLTDRKIGGDDNEFMYQFMVGYYFRKGDAANFEKYRKLGQELYPKAEYFTYTETDFIMGMEDEVEKMKRIEAKIAQNPDDIELVQTYGFILFDKLNAEGAERPANFDELESKMVANLSKAGEARPEDGKPYYFLGNHYVNKSVKINEEIRGVTDQIRKANANAVPDKKTGKIPPPPKELTDKRDALRKAYDAEIEKGLPYLVKSAEAYAKMKDMKGLDKQNYKRLADQLILIYGDKKAAAKVPADKAKWEAEEKKWNTVYSSISN